MKTCNTIADLRETLAPVRGAGSSIGLVPTMGALHEGHLSLIDAARTECDCVVVSIFVNPTQFGPSEDLDAYPRTPEADLAACQAHGVDLVLHPSVGEMYPRPCLIEVRADPLSRTLCGRSREGHFPGVCTVVAKLWNIVQPDRSYFGQKDFQQATILRRMAADLNFPLEVVVCPTVREADGLAMSSRNEYLSEAERVQAPALFGALCLAKEMIQEGCPPADEVVSAMRAYLAEQAPDGQIDYIQVVDPETLEDVAGTGRPVQIALAVKLGPARLIDNLAVDAAGAGA